MGEDRFLCLISSTAHRLGGRTKQIMALAVATCVSAAYSLPATAAGTAPSPDPRSALAISPSSGSSVLDPSVSVTPNVAGAQAAQYVVTFTLSQTGDLAASVGSIQMVVPAGATFNVVPPALVDHQHPDESNTNLLEAYSATVADNGEDYSISPNRELYPGDTIAVTIGDVINASRSGTYYLRLWTTADTVPVSVPFTLVPPTGQVTSPSVTLSSSAPGATKVSYDINFHTSAEGALAGGGCHSYWGETLDVSLPQGTGGFTPPPGPGPGGIEAYLKDYTNPADNGEPECGYGPYSNPDVSADGAVVVFAVANSVGAGDSLDLKLSGITNPTAPGRYSLLLWTMSDPSPVVLSYDIGGSSASPPAVGGAQLSTSSALAERTANYDLSFTTSAGGGMAAGSGVFYVLGPEGTNFSGATVVVKDESTCAPLRSELVTYRSARWAVTSWFGS